MRRRTAHAHAPHPGRYTHFEFAFLSAHYTAAHSRRGVLSRSQFAGFNGMHGMLWRVDDSIAHEVVTRFYRGVFNTNDLVL